MIKFNLIIALFVFIVNIYGNRQCQSKSSGLVLYVTPSTILFIYDEGFLPIQFYKNINGECCLYSLSDRINRGNKGIYKNDILFLNIHERFNSIDNFKIGDTLIALNSICNSMRELSIFNPIYFYEKQVAVKDYVLINLCHFKKRFEHDGIPTELTLIIDSSSREFNLIDNIDSLSENAGYTVTKTIGIHKKADDWIKYNYPYGDMIDSNENDSIMKVHYNELKMKRRIQKDSRIKCGAG